MGIETSVGLREYPNNTGCREGGWLPLGFETLDDLCHSNTTKLVEETAGFRWDLKQHEYVHQVK